MYKKIAISFICLLCIGITSYGSITSENPTNGSHDKYSQKFFPNSKIDKKSEKKNKLKNKSIAISSTQTARKLAFFISDLIMDEKKSISNSQLFVSNNNSSDISTNPL